MYSLSDLIIYTEPGIQDVNTIKRILIECNATFKELNSLKLVFSAIKNPQHYVIIAVHSRDMLHKIEDIAKLCFDFQNRIFIIFSSTGLNDNFFNNTCHLSQLHILKDFIKNKVCCNNIYPQQPHTLLYKLIKLELEKLDLATKYIGFEYLAESLTNALSTQFYTDNYIDIFQCVATSHLSTIDTIERNIRHMLSTTWKNSAKFKYILSTNCKIEKPNSKNILKAIIEYIKKVI